MTAAMTTYYQYYPSSTRGLVVRIDRELPGPEPAWETIWVELDDNKDKMNGGSFVNSEQMQLPGTTQLGHGVNRFPQTALSAAPEAYYRDWNGLLAANNRTLPMPVPLHVGIPPPRMPGTARPPSPLPSPMQISTLVCKSMILPSPVSMRQRVISILID